MTERPALPREQKLAYTVDEACEASGFGRTTIYELIKRGVLDARKFGSRTVILAVSLDAWLSSLPRVAQQHSPISSVSS